MLNAWENVPAHQVSCAQVSKISYKILYVAVDHHENSVVQRQGPVNYGVRSVKLKNWEVWWACYFKIQTPKTICNQLWKTESLWTVTHIHVWGKVIFFKVSIFWWTTVPTGLLDWKVFVKTDIICQSNIFTEIHFNKNIIDL